MDKDGRIGGEAMVAADKFYIKSRDLRLTHQEADMMGIKRVWNYVCDLDYVDEADIERWSRGLFDPARGESILVESVTRGVFGGSRDIHVTTCIVFYSVESSNIFFMKNKGTYSKADGFLHLYN